MFVSSWGLVVNPYFQPCHIDQNGFAEAELSEPPWHIPSAGAGPPGLPGKGAGGEGFCRALPVGGAPPGEPGRSSAPCKYTYEMSYELGWLNTWRVRNWIFFTKSLPTTQVGTMSCHSVSAALTNCYVDSLQLLDSQIPKVLSEAVFINTFKCIYCCQFC